MWTNPPPFQSRWNARAPFCASIGAVAQAINFFTCAAMKAALVAEVAALVAIVSQETEWQRFPQILGQERPKPSRR
jgi:hypothetical protein